MASASCTANPRDAERLPTTSGSNTPFVYTFSDTTFASGGGAGLIHRGDNTGFFDDFSLTEVPEPGTAALMMGACATLIAARRRR